MNLDDAKTVEIQFLSIPNALTLTTSAPTRNVFRAYHLHVFFDCTRLHSNLINTSEYHNVAQIRDSGDHPANHHLSMLPEHKPQKLMQLPLLSSSAAVVFGVPVDKSEHTLISQAASTIAAVLSVVAVTGDAEVVMQLPVLKRTET